MKSPIRTPVETSGKFRYLVHGLLVEAPLVIPAGPQANPSASSQQDLVVSVTRGDVLVPDGPEVLGVDEPANNRRYTVRVRNETWTLTFPGVASLELPKGSLDVAVTAASRHRTRC